MNSHVRFANLSKLIELHNDARSSGSWLWKIPELKESRGLMVYAQDWAENMASKDKLVHSFISDIIKLGFSNAGENIAYGQSTEESVINSWLRSPGHRKNIMNKNYTHIGCGFANSARGVPYWCVCFGKLK